MVTNVNSNEDIKMKRTKLGKEKYLRRKGVLESGMELDPVSKELN